MGAKVDRHGLKRRGGCTADGLERRRRRWKREARDASRGTSGEAMRSLPGGTAGIGGMRRGAETHRSRSSPARDGGGESVVEVLAASDCAQPCPPCFYLDGVGAAKEII